MNWKRLFLGSLILSTVLAATYFSLDWKTIETWGAWNSIMILSIIGIPSFTFFMWLFQTNENDVHQAQYNEGYLKATYHSLLEQYSKDPQNKELRFSILETGRKYYSILQQKNLDERILSDIESSLNQQDQAA